MVNLGDKAAAKPATGRQADHERLRHLRQELAHRGVAAAARPLAGTRNGRGRPGKQPAIAPSANGQAGSAATARSCISALLGSAKPVCGTWGSGTLVTTSLVSMLMTGGEVYIGAVQPSVLYAAVGHTS